MILQTELIIILKFILFLFISVSHSRRKHQEIRIFKFACTRRSKFILSLIGSGNQGLVWRSGSNHKNASTSAQQSFRVLRTAKVFHLIWFVSTSLNYVVGHVRACEVRRKRTTNPRAKCGHDAKIPVFNESVFLSSLVLIQGLKTMADHKWSGDYCYDMRLSYDFTGAPLEHVVNGGPSFLRDGL